MKKYLIHTQDVDGETKDVYDDQAKAVARFEEMYGYPIQNAIEEKYWLLDTPPTIETVNYVDAVSNFGTVVAYEVLEGSEQPITWEGFNRMRSVDNFYGCVAPDGAWFDSGMCYTTAVTHCCYKEGAFDLSVEGEAEWMNTEGQRLGYSIIHSTMLKQMFEKGLLK